MIHDGPNPVYPTWLHLFDHAGVERFRIHLDARELGWTPLAGFHGLGGELALQEVLPPQLLPLRAKDQRMAWTMQITCGDE